MADIYFNADYLGDPTRSYVAFLDIMGMQNHLTNSLKCSANFMFKFHAAMLSARKKLNYCSSDLVIYPIMDGAYVTSHKPKSMKRYLSVLFYMLADVYLRENNRDFRFIPRGAISYGEIHHGHDVPDEASAIFSDDSTYRANLLIGKPMVKAYQHERDAAPFGVFVDDCACCILHSDDDPNFKNWKWYKERPLLDVPKPDISKLANELQNAFESLSEVANSAEESQRHKVHRLAVKQYFANAAS